MKKIFLFFIILFITGYSVLAQKEYTITGTLQGVEDGRKITLTPGATHKSEKPVAEAIVKNGIFTFTGKLSEPRLFLLGIDGLDGSTPLLVENSVIQVKGKCSIIEEKNGKRVAFSDMSVEGSKAHVYYIKTCSVREDLDKANQAYRVNNKAILDSVSKLPFTSDGRKKFKDSDAYKKFIANEQDYVKLVDDTYNRIYKENSATFWGPLFMLTFSINLKEAQKPIYTVMSDEAKNSYYGKLVKAELFPESFIGKKAPSFTAADREGKMFSLKQLSGEYTIIDFWASWCLPCRFEIPNIKKLYEKYSSKGLAIISISLDKDGAKWEKALDEEKMSWPNLVDREGLSEKYNVRTIPAMFIMDKTGNVVGEKLRGEPLAAKLKELFGE